MPEDALLPLSTVQERIWLQDRISHPAPVYNESVSFEIHGEVDAARLRAAVETTIGRHEALHIVVRETPAGPRAAVADLPGDILEVASPDDVADARRLAEQFHRRPFDLARGPLVRALLVRAGAADAVFVLTAHHLVCDGWSLGLLVREIGERYRGATPAPVRRRYADFVAEERAAYGEGRGEDRLSEVAARLAGAPDLIKLPTDRPRPPAQTFAGDTRTVRVDPASSPLFDDLRRATGSTPFQVLTAAYATLLHRYSGQDAVAVGTTLLNRNHRDYLDVVGCFVNTGVMLFTFDEDTTFRNVLHQAGQASLALLDVQDVPFPRVLDRLGAARDPSHTPVFQTMLTHLGRRPELDLGPQQTVRHLPLSRPTSKFDLLLHVADDRDGSEIEAEFNTDLFDPETVERYLEHLNHLLGDLRARLDVEVSRLPVLPDAERRVILEQWNATAADYPEATVVDLIERQAARTPDAVAVEFRDEVVTYGELDRRTNRLARALQQRHEPQAYVGVYMERSVEMVVALVAVVKAGMAYVPIDPDYPQDRVSYMLDDAQVPLVLTQPHLRAALAASAVPVATVDELAGAVDDDSPVPRSLRPDSRVYMIYTSGSTGRPKGVVNRHAALFNRLYWMQSEYRLTEADRVLQKTPFSFDVSVWEFFWPLMFGARIVVAEPGGHRRPDYLKQLIHDRGVTTLHFVPSMLAVFLEEDDLRSHCVPVRQVFCSGEALPFSLVEAFAEALDAKLHNLYGPTEAAIDVSYWPCRTDYPGRVVPIGRPIANTQLLVLDRHLEIQPIGVPGELCIGGVNLAEGYHGKPDLTRAAFVDSPYPQITGPRIYRTGDLARYRADGQLEYLGRLDNQVKLRGFRIELGEIEAVVRRAPGVRDAAVVVHDSAGRQVLVAYVVAGPGYTEAAVRDAAKQQLPEFMVPQIVIGIPKIPTTPNGKLDRRALPDPAAHRGDTAVAAARTPAERVVAELWGLALGLTEVDVETNFFALGGDSITGVRIVGELRGRGYGVEIPDLFAHPTVRGLAARLTDRPAADGDAVPEPFALLTAEDRDTLPPAVMDAWPLSALQAGMIFHSLMSPGSAAYHDIFAYDWRAPFDAAALATAVALTIKDRMQLRSTVDLSSYDVPVQLVHAAAAPEIGHTDLRGLPRPEQDAAIAEWTEHEKGRDFDVELAAPIRFHVHRRADDEFTLVLSFHHAILDGWSVAQVIEDIRHRYALLLTRRTPQPAPEPIPYSAFVALEQRALADPGHREFWRGRLAAVTPTLLAPTAGSVPSPAEEHRVIPADVDGAVRQKAGEWSVPVKSVLLAAHHRALAAVTGRATVVTGLVANGRPELPGADRTAGLFLNTLPVRADVTVSGGPAALARQALREEEQLLPYRRYPLAAVLKDDGRGELFDTVFNYTDFHVYRTEDTPDVRITAARYFEQTNFPLVVHVHRDNFTGLLGLLVHYDAARVPAGVVARYADAYLAALAEASRPGGAGEEEADLARIAEIVGRTLGVPGIGPDDSLIERGLDSITGIRVVARLKRAGFPVAIADLFAHPTVRGLACARGAGTDPEIAATTGPATVLPITGLQLEMLQRHAEDVEQAVYHDVFSYRIVQPLIVAALTHAIRDTVQRHDTLRATFDLDADPPRRIITAHAEPVVEVIDLAGLSEDRQRAELTQRLEAEKRTGFDLGRAPLMRFLAHRLGSESFQLTLSFHHSVIDGWSLSLLVGDLIKAYTATLDGSAPAAVAAVPGDLLHEHAAAEAASRDSAATRRFWAEQLAGLTPLRLAGTSTGDGHRWHERSLPVPAERARALSDLAHELAVPLKHVLLAVHLAALSALSGGTEVVTAVFTNGRPEQEAAERAIGMFLNFVPVRHDLTGHTWTSLIRSVFEADTAALAHRRYPWRTIREDIAGVEPTDVAFNFTRFTAYDELPLIDVQWFEHTHFALLVNAGFGHTGRELTLTFNADGRRLSAPYLTGAAALYDRLLTDATHDRHASVIVELSKINSHGSALVER